MDEKAALTITNALFVEARVAAICSWVSGVDGIGAIITQHALREAKTLEKVGTSVSFQVTQPSRGVLILNFRVRHGYLARG